MSPIINPDTSAAQDMGPIAPGTYKAKIEAVEYKISDAGNPMIVPEFAVVVDGKAKKRKAFLVITGEGAYGFDQLLRATGFSQLADQYRDPQQANPDFDTDSLIGQELDVVIDHQMYKGEKRDAIKTYLKS